MYALTVVVIVLAILVGIGSLIWFLGWFFLWRPFPQIPVAPRERAEDVQKHNSREVPRVRRATGNHVKAAWRVKRPEAIQIEFENEIGLMCHRATLIHNNGVHDPSDPELLAGTTFVNITLVNGHVELTFSGGYILTCYGRLHLYDPTSTGTLH